MSVTGLTIAGGVTAVVLGWADDPFNHDAIALTTGLAGGGLVAYARYGLRLPWLSAPVVYLMLFWIFHFGMTFTAVLAPSVLSALPPDTTEWFYLRSARLSMLLGLLGAAAFTFGLGFFAGNPGRGPREQHPEHARGFYMGGWAVMLGGIVVSLGIFIQNGGLSIFSLTYLDFRRLLLGDTLLPNAIELSQLGCLLALCGAGARRWRLPVAVWAATIAGPMLLIGSRATAMIPFVAFAVALTSRGIRVHRGVLATGVLLASFAIPAVYAYRTVGFANRDQVNWTQVTPLDTVTELGGSLQSTAAYVGWIDERGDPFLLGLSYWAPFDRQVLTRVVPGREPVAYQDDVRIPLRLMDEREGAIGGSSTGEAYYNFGALGPLIYFAPIGLLFGWLNLRGEATAHGSAILGVVMLTLFFNIRSDFLAVPSQLGQGLALVAGCYLLDRVVFGARSARIDRVAPARPRRQPSNVPLQHLQR